MTESSDSNDADRHPVGAVLVHGAMHGAWSWDRVGEHLDAAGVPWISFDRYTDGSPRYVVSDEALNERLVRSSIEAAPFDRVVLVGHSAAGSAITAASFGNDRVAHLVYIAAFMVGGGIDPELEGDLVDALHTTEDGAVAVDPAAAAGLYYHDCSPFDRDAAVAQLLPQAPGLFDQPPPDSERVGWREVPSTYVVCAEDRAVNVDVQRRWAAQAGTTIELAASHSPLLSLPADVATVIAEAVRTTRGG